MRGKVGRQGHLVLPSATCTVGEDDVVLASDWQEQLEQLSERLDNFWHIVLLGWNYNSLLRRRDASGIEQISLFEPAYPEAEQI